MALRGGNTSNYMLQLADYSTAECFRFVNKDMVFVNGAKAYCKGLRDPDSGRGPNMNWVWYDEAGRDKTGMGWKLAIAGVRIGVEPKAWATYTPKDFYHWIDLYDDCMAMCSTPSSRHDHDMVENIEQRAQTRCLETTCKFYFDNCMKHPNAESSSNLTAEEVWIIVWIITSICKNFKKNLQNEFHILHKSIRMLSVFLKSKLQFPILIMESLNLLRICFGLPTIIKSIYRCFVSTLGLKNSIDQKTKIWSTFLFICLRMFCMKASSLERQLKSVSILIQTLKVLAVNYY
jgi:hypothetical protein